MPPSFYILDGGKAIGRIRLRSILRNKYSVVIDGVGSWTFRMPLFTVKFWGGTTTGPEIWVVVGPSKMEWRILLKPGAPDRHIVAALSFIHNEWWNYS
jgi:hypothetical protein